MIDRNRTLTQLQQLYRDTRDPHIMEIWTALWDEKITTAEANACIATAILPPALTESTKRKAAQEEYIIQLAERHGITTEQLETRIITDLAGGVPDEQTMTILTNMLEAARRVNESDGYDEFAPDYDALAQQDESVSQIQASREAAGLA